MLHLYSQLSFELILTQVPAAIATNAEWSWPDNSRPLWPQLELTNSSWEENCTPFRMKPGPPKLDAKTKGQLEGNSLTRQKMQFQVQSAKYHVDQGTNLPGFWHHNWRQMNSSSLWLHLLSWLVHLHFFFFKVLKSSNNEVNKVQLLIWGEEIAIISMRQRNCNHQYEGNKPQLSVYEAKKP